MELNYECTRPEMEENKRQFIIMQVHLTEILDSMYYHMQLVEFYLFSLFAVSRLKIGFTSGLC